MLGRTELWNNRLIYSLGREDLKSVCPRFAFIYHLSKETPLRRTDTVLSGLGTGTGGGTSVGGAGADSGPMVTASAPPHTAMDEPDLTRQASDLKIKTNSYK